MFGQKKNGKSKKYKYVVVYCVYMHIYDVVINFCMILSFPYMCIM